MGATCVVDRRDRPRGVRRARRERPRRRLGRRRAAPRRALDLLAARPRAAAPPALGRAGDRARLAVVGAAGHGDGRRAARGRPPPAARRGARSTRAWWPSCAAGSSATRWSPPSATACAGAPRRCWPPTALLEHPRRALAGRARPAAAVGRRAPAGPDGEPAQARLAARAHLRSARCAARPRARLTDAARRRAARRPRTLGDARPRLGASSSATGPCRGARAARDPGDAAATSRSSCPASGAAAAGTRRSRTSSAASSGAATRCSIWIDDPRRTRAARRPSATFFGPFEAAVHDDLTRVDAAPTSPSRPAGRPSRRCCCSAAAAPACTSSRTTSRSSIPPRPSACGPSARSSCRRSPPARGSRSGCARRACSATPFDLGIDHATYRPQPQHPRAADRVLFYARTATPRRAVPLGLLALEELHRRRPGTEIVLFGDAAPLAAPFAFTNLGILDPAEVARPRTRRRTRRRRPRAHEPLARRAGDGRLRPARRRAAHAEHRGGVRRLADRARARRPSSGWRTRIERQLAATSAGARTPSRPAVGRRRAPGTRPRRRPSSAACATQLYAACAAFPAPLAILLAVATIQFLAWMLRPARRSRRPTSTRTSPTRSD